MITVKSDGSFKNTEDFINRMRKGEAFKFLDAYGRQGVELLSSATPIDSSLTANSWDYEVIYKNGRYTIVWTNSNIESGVPVAILIQYGHATGGGGWVEGRDYINPAVRPLFDKMANQIWERVKNG